MAIFAGIIKEAMLLKKINNQTFVLRADSNVPPINILTFVLALGQFIWRRGNPCQVGEVKKTLKIETIKLYLFIFTINKFQI